MTRPPFRATAQIYHIRVKHDTTQRLMTMQTHSFVDCFNRINKKTPSSTDVLDLMTSISDYARTSQELYAQKVPFFDATATQRNLWMMADACTTHFFKTMGSYPINLQTVPKDIAVTTAAAYATTIETLMAMQPEDSFGLVPQRLGQMNGNLELIANRYPKTNGLTSTSRKLQRLRTGLMQRAPQRGMFQQPFQTIFGSSPSQS